MLSFSCSHKSIVSIAGEFSRFHRPLIHIAPLSAQNSYLELKDTSSHGNANDESTNRHKQFNSEFIVDGKQKHETLFDMIRNTTKKHPSDVISAYSDNAAVLEGHIGSFLAPSYSTGEWTQIKEQVHYLAKVETHNQ